MNSPIKYSILSLALFLFAGLGWADTAHAHCDSLDGPVVEDARIALEKGDITPVLKWVTEGQEQELRSVFRETVEVRHISNKVRNVADHRFFETLVRLHREAEGASFTGLKPAGTDFGPAIPAAEKALEEGSLRDVYELLTKEIHNGLHHYYEAVQRLSNYDPDDVEAARAWADAYVKYMHYIEPLYQMATSEVEHGVGGHGHSH